MSDQTFWAVQWVGNAVDRMDIAPETREGCRQTLEGPHVCIMESAYSIGAYEKARNQHPEWAFGGGWRGQ